MTETDSNAHLFGSSSLPTSQYWLYSVLYLNPDGTPHAMVLYDGSSWRDVQLPSELLHATYSDYNPELYRGLETACVASDRIFFTHNNNDLTWDLYCIDLTVEDLVMEYCGLLGYVEEEP